MKNSNISLHGSSLTKQCDIIDEQQENDLWNMHLLGTDNPKKLMVIIFYLIGLHFALRGREEHTHLSVKNFEIIHHKGKKCLKYQETYSKTYHGGIKHVKNKPKQVTAFQNTKNPFDIFMKHRPNNIDRFYFVLIKELMLINKTNCPKYYSCHSEKIL
jgi:hypothetical protein